MVLTRLIVSFTILIILIQAVLAADFNDLKRLKTDLKTGYDPLSRPTQNNNNATLVNFDLLLRGFEFDEKKGVFTLYTLANFEWRDDHMKWDPMSYGNITEIFFSAHEIWQPDITVYNNYESIIDPFDETRVFVQSTGDLMWFPLATIKVGCSANLRKWPYDEHTCKIEMGSWSHSAEKLCVNLSSNVTLLDMNDWVENREWRLVSNSIQLVEVSYSVSNQTITRQEIVLTINIQRQSSTHTAAIVFPAFIIATTILISFWLRPGASERLALILVVLVINSMFHYNVYVLMPNNGNEVPLVVLYYRDSLLMISVALIWTITLRFLATAERTSVPLPNFIVTFLQGWGSKCLCLDSKQIQDTDAQLESQSQTQLDQEIGINDTIRLVSNGDESYQKDLVWLAHLLDRIVFLIYLIVYLIFIVVLL